MNFKNLDKVLIIFGDNNFSFSQIGFLMNGQLGITLIFN